MPPILLAKMSKGQEIELTCKAYKVGSVPPSGIWAVWADGDLGYWQVSRQMVSIECSWIRIRPTQQAAAHDVLV